MWTDHPGKTQIKILKKVKKQANYAEIKGECESIRPFLYLGIKKTLHFVWGRFVYENYV